MTIKLTGGLTGMITDVLRGNRKPGDIFIQTDKGLAARYDTIVFELHREKPKVSFRFEGKEVGWMEIATYGTWTEGMSVTVTNMQGVMPFDIK